MEMNLFLVQDCSSKEEFVPPQFEGLNEPQQDGQRERPLRHCKEWFCDWLITTKEVKCATIAFFSCYQQHLVIGTTSQG
jgi:hypothetical protein